jgi:hypothetical protein
LQWKLIQTTKAREPDETQVVQALIEQECSSTEVPQESEIKDVPDLVPQELEDRDDEVEDMEEEESVSTIRYSTRMPMVCVSWRNIL